MLVELNSVFVLMQLTELQLCSGQQTDIHSVD